MKFAIHYTNDFHYLSDVDEIILDIYKGSNEILEFVPKIDPNKDKRIIIDLRSTNEINESVTYIAKLREDGYNLAVIVSYNFGTDLINNRLKENNIPFMYGNYAVTLEQAYIQAENGASDIYVAEELAFRIKDLQRIRNKYNIKLRVFPNIAQTARRGMDIVPFEKKFWIRPEDIEVYEPFVDVFEIYGLAKANVIYEIYKQEQWKGDLGDLILSSGHHKIPNSGLDSHFGEVRLNCGKRCLLGECNLCSAMAEFAKQFDEAGIEVIKPKKQVQSKESIELLEKMKNEPGINKDSM